MTLIVTLVTLNRPIVTCAPFPLVTRCPRPATRRQDLRAAFKDIDRTGRGLLGPEDLRFALRRFGVRAL